jgi:hypothetical protein
MSTEIKTMKRYTRHLGRTCASVLIGSALLAGCSAVSAQQDQKPSGVNNRSNAPGRDPFRKYEPSRVILKKGNVVAPPSIEVRISQYRAQKQAAMNARVAAPKPTTAVLLSEIQVVGISRTPRGYAAIVEATPIKMSFVIYPGEKFYDGQLVAIDDNRLVFRREMVFTDGRRERSVELKPLRQPSTVDTFAAAKSSPTTTAAEPERVGAKPVSEKP